MDKNTITLYKFLATRKLAMPNDTPTVHAHYRLKRPTFRVVIKYFSSTEHVINKLSEKKIYPKTITLKNKNTQFRHSSLPSKTESRLTRP